MKAIVCSRYGLPEVLRREERATPVPRKNAVRIRILATAVTSVARGVGNEGEIAIARPGPIPGAVVWSKKGLLARWTSSW